MNRSPLVRLLLLLSASLALVVGFLAPPASAAGPKGFDALPATLGAVADGPGSPDGTTDCSFDGRARVVRVPVKKLKGAITDVRVKLTLNHAWVGDLAVTVVAPNGASALVFDSTGAVQDNGCGSDSDAGGTYTFADGASGSWWDAAAAGGVIPSGKYAPSQAGGNGSTGAPTAITPAFAGLPAKGTWQIRVVDSGRGDAGSVDAASLILTTDG